GIDTVKQVDIFTRTREHFGVPRDPARSLRDFNTLRRVIDHIVERVLTTSAAASAQPVPAPAPAPAATKARPSAPPAPVAAPAMAAYSSLAPPVPAPDEIRLSAYPPAPAPAAARPNTVQASTSSMVSPVPFSTETREDLTEQVRTVLMRNVVEKTGYPEDMLELDLDLEADLGIDTVKQVDIFTRTREHFGVPRDPARSLRDFNTLRRVIDHIVERAQSTSATERAAAAVHLAATSVSPSQVEPKGRSGQGGPRSVREALLALDLPRTGVKPEEIRKLGEAMSSALGTTAPETGKVRTLGELAQQLVKDR
ncbi:MAG TPA: phosphopantetheine-binding protein, partial [Archangium sp.]|uniref:acyl carrier protein n=1 Tax=Archangium sp. TaxID=1872627 RepID=UPI002ED9629E